MILRLPRNLVLTAVVVFSVVGAFALRNSLFDVYVMVAFGVVGFYLESQRVPVAPLILGLILGPMVEENLRAGLIKTGGSFGPFLTRPISLVLWLLLVGSFVGPWLCAACGGRRGLTVARRPRERGGIVRKSLRPNNCSRTTVIKAGQTKRMNTIQTCAGEIPPIQGRVNPGAP
jgi:hypothetical protein